MKIILAILLIINNYTVIQSRNLSLNGSTYYTVYDRQGNCIADDISLDNLIDFAMRKKEGKTKCIFSQSHYSELLSHKLKASYSFLSPLECTNYGETYE